MSVDCGSIFQQMYSVIPMPPFGIEHNVVHLRGFINNVNFQFSMCYAELEPHKPRVCIDDM